ncbi:MAG: hypothetical protein Q9219_001856 [cf. Caloplaca sp. 3 TL-2023]
MADTFLLRVTAGPSYDPASHQIVAVNSGIPTTVRSPLCDANIVVRIQNYRGDNETDTKFTRTFAAFRILKWAIDPGLDGDVYADKPYLYGNALSSINILSVGPKAEDDGLNDLLGVEDKDGDEAIVEGGFGGGQELREGLHIPENAAARQKWFLGGHDRLKNWGWEEGRLYKADFFNPYLDFNEFALKLPGFSLKVLGYLGGEDYLRYVLKDKETDEVLFVVVFTLLPKEQMDENEAQTAQPGVFNVQTEKSFEPKADDVD